MDNSRYWQDLHSKVWAFRNEMAPVWPTPNTLDALKFCVTEAAEALDADLRINGGYARNHTKEPNLYGELADCALMLLTALGPDWDNVPDIFDAIDEAQWPLDELVGNCADALYWYHISEQGRAPDGWVFEEIVKALIAIRYYADDFNLEAELDKRMARLRAKHMLATT